MNTWQITQEDGNGWTVYRFVVRHDDGVMMLSQSYGSPAEVQAGLVEYAGRHDLDVDWGSASARRGRLVPR